MSLFIREATPSDWLPVRDLLKEAFDHANYNRIPTDQFTENRVKRTFHVAVVSPNALVLVVTDKKHRIHGIFMAQMALNWWGANTAMELASYCNKPGWMHRLLRRYKAWAEEQGADSVSVINSGGNERYNTLIERMGFNKVGAAFMAFPAGA